MTYSSYLGLDELLTCQEPRSTHHDELLFIIQHQTSELWFKLIIHELRSAVGWLGANNYSPCFKVLARVKHIQAQLFNQWSVLATLTPSEYSQFRGVLGSSSGFQSWQYRMVEFLMGNKNRGMIQLHKHDAAAVEALNQTLSEPSIYDAFIAAMARAGFDIAPEVLDRDVTKQYEAHPSVLEAFKKVYRDPDAHYAEYEMAEKLVDLEEQFALWRFRHLKTVERIIGYKMGTGGSQGVPFLRKLVEHVFFPELWGVRTEL
ncbi:MAG: tryptophan 2,3-dioxygenase family protein [Planctomycetota bacterium]